MTGSLIINARHRLAWHQRLVSDASTAMMWAVWLWLWAPILRSSGWLADFGLRFYPSLLKVLGSGSPEDIPRSLMALVGTSGTLLVLNQLPAPRTRAAAALTVRDYARHFDLPADELLTGRNAAVCVGHHDDEGRIVRIDARGPAAEVEARVAAA